MSEYKRLTKEKITKDNVILHRNIYGNIVISQEVWDMFEKEHNRLAELEDKIENGTLIETEYPIYQDVYFIDYVDENYYSVGAGKGKPTVRKAFIHSVEQVMKGQILYLVQPQDLPQEVLDNEVEHTETWEWFHYSKKNLFLTKAEAEQRLKELKDE